ncbi:MAG: HAD family phosphatase [Brumimicrobium sp.]|nr:HAD family phosphatase [Brumimicrobium sp.]MCO5268121.1 HAD family phosphatase [Brumimicrobium sp.]
MVQSTIKNIILDFGGVLLNIDYNKTIEAFKQLGIPHFEKMYAQLHQTDLFNQFEKGEISKEQFIEELKSFLPTNITDDAIVHAWNAMLLNFPKERLDLLLHLKQNYNLVLLSNTNFIHIEQFNLNLYSEHGISSLKPFFQTIYFSCEMGMKKPDIEIFLEVCLKEDFLPSETLFIDDSPQHIEGALRAGINAYLLDTKKENIIELLHRLQLIKK